MNITTVTFSSKTETYGLAAPALWQYDYGQVLKIEGLDLPTAYQVEFANSANAGQTITEVGNADGVSIPDSLLETGKNVYAFVFLHDEETDGETEYKITILVNPRPSRPNDTPTPEQQSAIDQAIAALNNAVERTDESAEAAAGSATSAAGSAAAAADSAEDAADSENNAANSATAANNAAIRARESSETASLLADEAIAAASQARASATAAAQSATNAAESASSSAQSALSAAASAQSAAVAAQTASGAVAAVQQSAETASAAAQSAGESATAAAASAAAAAASEAEAQRIEAALEPLDGLPGRVSTLEEELGFALYPAWVAGSYTSYGYQDTPARKRTDKLPAGRYSAAINADYILSAVKFVSDTRGINIVKSESGGRYYFESDRPIILNTRRADNTSVAAMTDAEINAIWQLKGEPITDRVEALEEAVDGYGAAAQPAAGTDMVATRSIANGEYFAAGYGLYQATAAIASGETIVSGTNCTQTSSAAALNALRSGKQDQLTFDSTPTAGSSNPVTSGGVAAAVAEIDGEVSALKSSLSDTQAMIATVEPSATASKSYAIGDLLVYNGTLCEVTEAIPAGATITPGSNVTQTTVEAQIAAGGGGGSGGGSGGEALRVNVTVDVGAAIPGERPTFIADKTLEEIFSAFSAGQYVYAVLSNKVYSPHNFQTDYVDFTLISVESDGVYISFLSINEDNSVSLYVNKYPST